MKIRSQLTSPQVAVDRNIDNTVIDKIDVVNSNIDAIAALGAPEAIADMNVLADVDWAAIEAQVGTLDGLTVEVVETLPAGSQASAELVGNTIELRIPKGVDGTDGVDGYTPVKGTDYSDGVDGTNGVDGQDGYTPIKGIDYVDGIRGATGYDGRTPIMEFTYNPSTGDIEYEVVGHEEIQTEIGEW